MVRVFPSPSVRQDIVLAEEQNPQWQLPPGNSTYWLIAPLLPPPQGFRHPRNPLQEEKILNPKHLYFI